MQNRDPTSASCVFLVYLLLTPASPACRNGTFDECRKAGFLPGYKYAGKSFDISRLMLRPFYHEIVNDSECTLCENPLLKGKPFQRLPSVITDWKAQVSCQDKVLQSSHQSVISVAQELTELQVKNNWMKELDLNIAPRKKFQWALAGSRSELIQECIEKSLQDKYIFLLHHITCSYYKFRVSSIHSALFTQSLSNLPEYFNSSTKMRYFQHIKLFGTHFLSQLDLGAYIRYLTAFSLCELVLEGLTVDEVSQCLAIDVGIAFGLGGLINSPEFQDCEEKKKRISFYSLSKSSIMRDGYWNPSGSPKEQLESAKYAPTLVSFSLEPLHTLVDGTNPRKESLRRALSAYVRENIMWRNCTKTCPPGSQPSEYDFCSCECPNDEFTTSMCCAAKRGTGKLSVTIEHAEGLWGDYLTRTDGYVSVSFQNKRMCTHTVWNNNSPTWNVTLDFGFLQLDQHSNQLQVEVWDQDSGWDDDRLGVCKLTMETETIMPQTCSLKRGRIYFTYRLFCGRKLFGSSCWRYSTMWPYFESDYDYYHY